MLVLILLYTLSTYHYLRMKTHKGRNQACGMQLFCMFALHLTGYLAIILYTGETAMIYFYLVQVAFFILYLVLFRIFYKKASRLLLNNTCMLLSVSFIMLTRLGAEGAVRHFIITAVAASIAMVVPLIVRQMRYLWRFGWIYAGIGIVALMAIFAFSTVKHGAYLSFDIGGLFSLQPSEFVKITFVFFVASMFQTSLSFKRVFVTTAVAALHVLILVASKDLGAALIYFIAYLLMLFVATRSYFYLVGGAAAGSIAAVLAYQVFGHVKVRVQVWQDPWMDATGDGWQVLQSLFAIGSGGFLGTGLYQGMPEKIPVVRSDFIFAGISEEMGGIFAIALILICLSCLLQFLWISTWMDGMFYKIIAFGLAAVYGAQVFLNIGGVIKFIPSTGITLPFVSHGGSSILSTFIMFGIIQGLYILKQDEVDRIEQEEKLERRRQALYAKRYETGTAGAGKPGERTRRNSPGRRAYKKSK
ncbi:MAG: FtsW/RodA/SpoVE family cell cycle protein [Lachnospiraceae bacterium]|nr:FtsW/RodA/SpoVE family cell cycle protein [Lachnospiraceae bacterium]